jgi:pimeloyl-ACP methyl ester carboxylesterase
MRLLITVLVVGIPSFAQVPERISVQSRDGTRISVQKIGNGPALLLVHGSTIDGTAWQRVLPGLSKHFTVYVMDRRGHGSSGDARTYAISAEADDIAAVTSVIGQPLTLLGHSYGALCVLVAFDRLQHVSQLILYEPPLTADNSSPPRDDSKRTMAKMDQALEANDQEEVLTLFLRDLAKIPAEDIAIMKASPNWAARVSMASALPRELHAMMSLRISKNALARCKMPVAMLLGSTSPDSTRETTNFICQSISGCQVIMLEGQGHLAPVFAPDLFVTKVREAMAHVGQR